MLLWSFLVCLKAVLGVIFNGTLGHSRDVGGMFECTWNRNRKFTPKWSNLWHSWAIFDHVVYYSSRLWTLCCFWSCFGVTCVPPLAAHRIVSGVVWRFQGFIWNFMAVLGTFDGALFAGLLSNSMPDNLGCSYRDHPFCGRDRAMSAIHSLWVLAAFILWAPFTAVDGILGCCWGLQWYS